MKQFLYSLLLLTSASLYSQEVDNFVALESGSDVPKYFMERSQDKYEKDLRQNTNDELKNDFFLSTRFFIDELLLSGNILFDEPLSKYLNKVARYTLRSEKKLYDELQFYVIKSTTINAFSTDQGVIIFTTGLLGQVENEAQLAYIIAHEVAHYTEGHVRESYIEKATYRKGTGRYGRMDYETRVSELSIYEKSNELEADKKGIDIFLKTEYSVDEIFTSFEMLLYSYLPFDERDFDSTYFDTEILKIPGAYFPDTINEITREEDYDDANSTHPNIMKRMDGAYEYLNNRVSRGSLKYKISEDEFTKVQTLARFENLNLLLVQREYGKAIYNVYLLSEAYPDNRFLDLCLVKSLYGLAKYKNGRRYREVVEKPKDMEGSSFLLHLFLYDLSREEVSVLAYRHAYDMTKKYPGDKIFALYEKDMKRELALNADLDLDDLQSTSYVEFVEEFEEDTTTAFNIEDSIAAIDASDMSKYQKIRLKKELRSMEEDLDAKEEGEYEFYKYALYDLVSQGRFMDELEDIRREARKEEDQSEADYVYIANRGGGADLKEPREDIKRVVIVDPSYEIYRLNRKRNFEEEEEKKIDLSYSYLKDYPKIDVRRELVDSKNLAPSDGDKYNDLGLMYAWLSEILEKEDLDMICSTHDRMMDVREKYDTDHFLFTGVSAYKDRNQFNANHLYGIMFIYTIPIVIVDLLIVHNYFELFSVSFDAERDAVEFVYSSDVNLKGNDKVLEAYIYDMLYELDNAKEN